MSNSFFQPERKKNLSGWLAPIISNGTVVSIILFVAVFLVYASSANGVFTAFSMNNLFNNTVALAIAATGLTLIILIGGFDLSVGGVMVLSNVIIASYGGEGVGGVITSFMLVVLVGSIVGAINGFVVAYMGVQSIAVTLATMIMCEGLALVIMPAPGGSVSSILTGQLTSALFGWLPVVSVILLIVVCVWLLLKRLPFGVHMYAIGADERASLQAGIPVKKVKFFTFVLAGVFYGIAGFMHTAQTASGDPTSSMIFLLLVFASVAIGGTAFGGGKGGVIGSIVGAGILTLLQKTLFAVGVSSFYTSIFEGIILIAAVLIGGLSGVLSKTREARLP
jgi:ribose transport system permease protein